MVALEETTMSDINSVTELVTGDQSGDRKMTYNEWRQMRKMRHMLYKAPVCKTTLESLKVQPGYSIKLSVEISGYPTPSVTWSLDNEELECDDKFTIEHNIENSTYSLVISQITTHEEGCYRCYAENEAGSDSTIAFITVKDTSRRRKRSVSQRPHISTIREWKSKEEEEKVDRDPKEERLLLRNRQCWDWWNLNAASDDEKRGDREGSCDLLEGKGEASSENLTSKTEEEWESKRRSKNPLTRTRSRSLPPEPKPKTNPATTEDKMKKLRSFWESKRYR